MPREEQFVQIIDKLHQRWRLAVMTPLVYLFLAWLFMEKYLEPQGKSGLMPLSEPVFVLLLLLFTLVFVVLWRGLEQKVRLDLLTLTESREDPAAFLQHARRQQLLHFAFCDLANLPGILLFLLQGAVFPLLLFCLGSMVLYLRTMPSSRLLGQAFFRPDLLHR